MKGFRFRLERLLRLRRYEFEQARRAWLMAKEQHSASTKARCDLENRSNEQIESLHAHIQNGIQASKAGIVFRSLAGMQQKVSEAKQIEENARKKAQKMREHSLKARSRMRSLELLREKTLAEFRFEQQRREQYELDEVAARVRRGGVQ